MAAAAAALRGRFGRSLRTLASHIPAGQPGSAGLHRLFTQLQAMVADDCPPPEAPPRSGFTYVLFFYGGSRGNPGPGGAGAVVSAAISLAAPTTTNNRVEYIGLITGLAVAHCHNWTPLHVVGDSVLIIGQLSAYRSPKNDILKRLYASARVIADQLGVEQWSHHLRPYNNMADAAANIAMDTRRSIQTHHPTDRPEWAGLNQLLAGDVFQWQTSQLGSL